MGPEHPRRRGQELRRGAHRMGREQDPRKEEVEHRGAHRRGREGRRRDRAAGHQSQVGPGETCLAAHQTLVGLLLVLRGREMDRVLRGRDRELGPCQEQG